ncbi:MAG TPA: hypothetical protein VF246_04510 [Acidimicrobiia bacterium]
MKTHYDTERSTMIQMANILLGDLRRKAAEERLARKVTRPGRVIHLGLRRVDRNHDAAA